MAPLAELPDTQLMGNILTHRDTPEHTLSDDHARLVSLMALSISLASISVIAALIAFYWFVRMRRSFRQDLIMLLIQSDMMKALWLVICPLAYFAGIPLEPDSTFCQVSGYFLTVTIEASDIAVLLIAIHTVLFVLKAVQGTGGASGLHPYRRIAYSAWFVVPIIQAAVVPITGGRFIGSGTYCYLPVRPAWYRRALSWAPRYAVLGFIIATYTLLYLYVGIRYQRLASDRRRASSNLSENSSRRKHRHKARDVPPTPTITDHGLLDPVPNIRGDGTEPKDRQVSVASTVSTLRLGESLGVPKTTRQIRRNSITFHLVSFGGDSATESVSRDPTPISPRSQPFSAATTVASQTPIRIPEPTAHRQNSSTLPSQTGDQFLPSPERTDTFEAPTPLRLGSSLTYIIAALRRGPPRHQSNATHDENAEGSPTPASSCVYLSPEARDGAVQRSRDKMRWQLRLLFVYPLIYTLTWVAPFMSHVLGFDETDHPGRRKEPFALQVVGVASLCMGAAVDCCFFTAWEKPWRHRQHGARSFWDSLLVSHLGWLRRRSHHYNRPTTSSIAGGGGGWTQENRRMGARSAGLRRDREIMTAQGLAAMARTAPRGRPREWWDVYDVGRDSDLIDLT
ncbi:G protein-coupled glucose receptor regulating Gpa2-domain-containing protein [Xylariomycetidae sp. FL2044]|nr:G protein-coupled glucose receptor regulating Gpa2-domain-containing protein [Xylariomycetidae sp. FL2044]